MNSKALLHFKFFNTAIFLGKSEALIERQRQRLVENAYFNFNHFYDLVADDSGMITCKSLKMFYNQDLKI